MLSWALTTLDELVITLTIYVLILVPLTLFLVKLAIDSIFCAVVYRYVTAHDAGEFDADLLQAAFVARPPRRRRKQSTA